VENLELLLRGFSVALTPDNLGAALLGAILGLIVGAMPGIGSLAGVALLLPLTYKFNPTTAIIMLGAIYYANMYGGSFSAILLNIPGDSPAVMTALDGYPMATNASLHTILSSVSFLPAFNASNTSLFFVGSTVLIAVAIISTLSP